MDQTSSNRAEDKYLLIPVETKVYKRRWYILTLFIACGVMEGILYNTWGPINQSAKLVYSWSNTELALLVNWGNMTYGVFVLFASYMMDVKGLRVSMLCTICLLSVGSGLRLITMEPGRATWLINVGQVLIGLGGCVPYSGVSLLSSIWFPQNQRTTATAMASVSSFIGDGLSFIAGPVIMKHLSRSRLDETPIFNESYGQIRLDHYSLPNYTDVYSMEKQREELFGLYLIEFSCTVGLGVLLLLYFPSKPPSAVSKSSAEKRMKYKDGLLSLTRSSQFWLINIGFSPNGVFMGWVSVLAVMLSPAGIEQEDAGWIGFIMVMSSCVSALTVSRFADLFSGHIKRTVLGMYFVSIICLVWLILIEMSILPFSLVQVYVSCALIGMCINGSFPLFMEMACEGAYPVAEGITCGYLTMVHNTSTVIFLAILMVPNIEPIWANCVFVCVIILAVPFIVQYKADRKRSYVDISEAEEYVFMEIVYNK